MPTVSCASRPVSDELTHVVRAYGRRRCRVMQTSRATRAIWLWGVGLLAVILVDAAWPMPAGVRLSWAVAIVVGWIVTCYVLWPARHDGQAQSMRDALWIDEKLCPESDRFINALSLSPLAQGGSENFASVLAQRSVLLAMRTLDRSRLDREIDFAFLRRQVVTVAAVCAIWLMVLWVQPRLIGGGVARLVWPFADHPSFSTTIFNVSVSPTPVTAGQDAVVTATLTGRIAERAELVELGPGHQVTRRWPMRRVASGGFERRLLALREPMTFRIETQNGRSRRFHIEPVSVTKPKQPKPPTDPWEAGPAPSGQAQPGVIEAARQAVVALGALADSAARLRSLTSQLLARWGRHDDPGTRRWLTQQTDQLNDRLDRFQSERRSLEQSLRHRARDGVAGSQPQGMTALLLAAAQRLDQLALNRLGPSSSSGQNDGRGSGRSQGPQSVAQWLEDVRTGAQRDEAVIGEAMAQVDRFLASAAGGSPVEESDTSEGGSIRPGETHEEILTRATPLRDQADAIMQRVPMSYRQAVAWYFDRLGQDDGGATAGRPD